MIPGLYTSGTVSEAAMNDNEANEHENENCRNDSKNDDSGNIGFCIGRGGLDGVYRGGVSQGDGRLRGRVW